jgi:hypothetical protein
MFRFMLIPALLLLAGCIDVDFTLDFTSRNSANADAEMRMTRSFYDMIGQSPESLCEDAEVELTDTALICRMQSSGTVDDLVSGAGFGEEMEMDEGMSITREGDDMVRVVFDLATIMTSGEDGPSPEELRQMSDMFGPMMEGHELIFRVRGAEIVESNGEIAADGQSASRTVPLDALLQEDPGLGSFETLVRLP